MHELACKWDTILIRNDSTVLSKRYFTYFYIKFVQRFVESNEFFSSFNTQAFINIKGGSYKF